MTDPTASDPAPATGDTLATGAAPQATVRSPRWRRRLLIAALVVGLRLALGVGLTPIARAALAAGGLEGVDFLGAGPAGRPGGDRRAAALSGVRSGESSAGARRTRRRWSPPPRSCSTWTRRRC